MSAIIAEPPAAEAAELGEAPETSETKSLFDNFRKNMAEAAASERGEALPAEPPKSDAPAVDPDKAKADAAAAEAAAKTKPIDDLPPEIKSPKAAETFKALKHERDEASKKAATFEARVKELESKTAANAEQTAEITRLQAELAETRQQADQYSERLQVLDIERHPKFEAHYGGKMKSALELARQEAGEQGDALVKLLSQRDSPYVREQVQAILVEMPDLNAHIIKDVIKDIRALELEKAGEISKAKENYTRLQQMEAAKRDQETKSLRERQNTAASQTLERARTLDAFKLIDGDEEHNKAVKVSEKFVQAFFRGEVPDEVFAWTPVLASEAIHLRNNVLPQLRAELEKTKAELTAMMSSSPSPGGGEGGAKEEGATPDHEETFMERFHRAQKE